MNTTRPRYRPEWATLLGWYFSLIGCSGIINAAIEYVELITRFDPGPESLQLFLNTFLPNAAYPGVSLIAGAWTLKRPRRAKAAIRMLITVILITGAISAYALLRFMETQPDIAPPGMNLGVMSARTLIGLLPLIAILVFLRTGRRRLFFAGESSSLFCSACDYDLKGLVSVRCPECGTEY